MVHRPTPSNAIYHLRMGDTGQTLCGRKYGRVYVARPGTPATCIKCLKLDAALTQGGEGDER